MKYIRCSKTMHTEIIGGYLCFLISINQLTVIGHGVHGVLVITLAIKQGKSL